MYIHRRTYICKNANMCTLMHVCTYTRYHHTRYGPVGFYCEVRGPKIRVRKHNYVSLHTNRTGMVKQLFAVMSRCREPPKIWIMCFDIVMQLCKLDKACATAGIHEAYGAYLQCPLRSSDDAQGAGASSETSVNTRPAPADWWPEFRGPRVTGRTLESDAKFFDMMRALVEQVKCCLLLE
jgi:hypothetical protein